MPAASSSNGIGAESGQADASEIDPDVLASVFGMVGDIFTGIGGLAAGGQPAAAPTSAPTSAPARTRPPPQQPPSPAPADWMKWAPWALGGGLVLLLVTRR